MTNQEYIKAIEMRRSRRTYRTTALDSETMDVIREMVDIVNKNHNLDFRFVEDATPAFKLFTGKFSLIAVCGDDSEMMRVKSGYYGESIILQCVYHGLGTCWVSGTYDENKVLAMLNLPKGTRLYAVIVIGLVKDKLSTKEKIMYNVTHKQNKPYQKMFDVCDKKLPPYYEQGMKMVEKAPSGTNSRPVHFRYEDGVISAHVDEPYSEKSIDFGIAQLHFCIGAASKGLKGQWDRTGRFCVEDRKIIKVDNLQGDVENE